MLAGKGACNEEPPVIIGKRLGIYGIDPTLSDRPFLNSAAVDPAEPALI